MREQFRVDLRGLVDVLSHHLYSSERIFLRELIQNARDAIAARRALGDDVRGEVVIVPALGTAPLVVRDDGIGLTADDMRAMLATIGSTSKRGDLVEARREFLGQFGIGLLAGFLVADSIEVVSRSARTPDAPTVRWVGSADGSFTIGDALTPLPAPGTEVRIRPRHGAYRWCEGTACLQFAREFAALLDVTVYVGGTLVSQQTPPWDLGIEDQLAWCQEHFGFEAMGIIPLNSTSTNVTGLAFVLPYTARPGYRTGDRIYARGMLVADTDNLIVPRWAFFCRAVIDAADLPLTASREGLQESPTLQFARARIGFQLLTELVLVHGRYPEVYRQIIRIHADGLKALAVHEPDVRDLLRTTLPYETTHGDRTIEQLVDVPEPVPYVRDGDTYHALSDVAAHADVLLVNASGLHEADLLGLVDDCEHDHFQEVGAREIIELVDPEPLADHLARPLVTRAERALRDEGVAVRVASFEPADKPVLWWPAARTANGPDDVRGPGATLILNACNPTIAAMVAAPASTDRAGPWLALYVTALLLGRHRPTQGQVALLRSAVLDMVDRDVSDRALDAPRDVTQNAS